jgi:rRNA maturation protein Nop10
MTSTMAKAMTGCSPYVLRVKCTQDGSFIAASLPSPRIPADDQQVPATGSPLSRPTLSTDLRAILG